MIIKKDLKEQVPKTTNKDKKRSIKSSNRSDPLKDNFVKNKSNKKDHSHLQ